jgi:murein DD-endopeptidase MepM/ murein hydrolase activator NlpD
VNLLAHLNGVRDAQRLPVGHYLYIPPTNVYPPFLRRNAYATASAKSSEAQPAAVSKGDGRERTVSPSRNPGLRREVQKARRKYGFDYPVRGRIIRWFSEDAADVHKGIDIAAREGTPILASRSGQVIYSGHQIPGYGNLIIIDHGDGFASLYANNQKNLVKKINQRVKKGDVIALVGRTSQAGPAHLHFEIRKDSVAVDPCGYLP